MGILQIEVKAHPRSRQCHIEKREGVYHVWIHEAPADGKANIAIIKMLSKHFKVARSKITLIKGHHTRRKIFEIITNQKI